MVYERGNIPHFATNEDFILGFEWQIAVGKACIKEIGIIFLERKYDWKKFHNHIGGVLRSSFTNLFVEREEISIVSLEPHEIQNRF